MVKGGNLWTLPGPISTQANPPSAVHLGPHPGGFWRSPGKPPPASGQPIQCCHWHSTEVLPGIEMEPPVSQYVPAVSCPGPGHQHPLCTFPSDIYSVDIPPSPPFSRPLSPSSVSLSSQQRCSGPIITLAALCWTLSSTPFSLWQ